LGEILAESSKKEEPHNFSIEKAILDAAQAIASATGVLMHNASLAQTERIRLRAERGGRKHPQDPLWANGLMSAAQNVTRCVEDLYTAACAVAEGKADESLIVEKARAVGTTTGHLVSASRVHADPDSDAQKKIKAAAQAIMDATGHLVDAVAAIHQRREEEEAMKVEETVASKKVFELEQKMRILKLEKEIDRERRKLLQIRRAKQLQ